ncbi:VacJ family lipoprotein [Veronia pacifica]|uniref:ABC transporter n=1 Tax=Veronia pacifica TaxID=1080227 RepID=A0A1C3EEF2_9GAMM|nr:MlaA family lipoprotein [Veronia pacifica]ODA31637.1 ABC transporter [Veronia pacifica]
MYFKRLILAIGLIFIVTGCVQTPQEQAGLEVRTNPDDPLEEFNRAMWAVNYDYLDPYLVKPASDIYVGYVPSWTRKGLSNFIDNLSEPASMINSIFMLEGKDAVNHFNRFWINTLFGLGGIIDIASAANIQKMSDREFGDAAGHYDVGHGAYLMIPGYGPTTVRASAGKVVDGLYPPLALLSFPQAVAKFVIGGLETRAELSKQQALLDSSPDPYKFVRDAYLQNQDFKARGNDTEVEELNDEDLEGLLDEIDE